MEEKIAHEVAARLTQDLVSLGGLTAVVTAPLTLACSGKFNSHTVLRKTINGGEPLLLKSFRVNDSGVMVALFSPVMGTSVLSSVGLVHVPLEDRKGRKWTDGEYIELKDADSTMSLQAYVEARLATYDDIDANNLAQLAELEATRSAKQRAEQWASDDRAGSW